MIRKRRAIKNIVSNLLLNAMLVASSFILPKLILMNYGSVMNGLINSITQFLTYLLLVEMGIGNAAVVALFQPIADGNQKEINAILTKTKSKYIMSGTVYVVAVILLAMLYPLLIDEKIEYKVIFSLVVVIAGSGLIDFYLIGKYKVFLIASQKYYVLNFVRVVEIALTIAGSCYMLLSSCSLIGVKFLAVATHFCSAVIIIGYVKMKYPKVFFNNEDSNVRIMQQENALIHQFTSVIIYNTDLVVLTICLPGNSLKEISVYTIYAMIFSMVTNIANSMTTGMNAFYGEMIAKKEKKQMLVQFDKYEKLYLTAIYILYTCFIVLCVPFVRCYTRGINDVNYIRNTVGILFGIMGLVAQIKDPEGVLIAAAGHYKQTQKYVIAEAVTNIMISLLLVRVFGIEGVLIGTIVAHFITDFGMIKYANSKILERPAEKSFVRNMRNLFVMVILSVWEFEKVQSIDGFVQWIIAGICVCFINSIVFLAGNYGYRLIFKRRMEE